MLLAESPWQARLGQDFDVRRLAFGTQLRAVDDFSALAFDGVGTSMSGALESLARRFRGLPIAGVLLFSDGNATDVALPPTCHGPNCRRSIRWWQATATRWST